MFGPGSDVFLVQSMFRFSFFLSCEKVCSALPCWVKAMILLWATLSIWTTDTSFPLSSVPSDDFMMHGIPTA